MAEYQSRYAQLTFYVEGKAYSFKNGRFVTDDEKVIKALETISDAVRVDEQKQSQANKAEEKPPAPEKETKKPSAK